MDGHLNMEVEQVVRKLKSEAVQKRLESRHIGALLGRRPLS